MTTQIRDINFTANPEAVGSFHDDGVVILHAGNGRLFSSNKTGALIWRGIEQRRSLDGIVQQISGEFEIPRPTARVHTLNFLASLERQALIRTEVAS